MDLLEAQELAITTMEKHGLDDWKFSWSRAKSYLGLCSYSKQTIFLSKPLTEVNSVETMTDTIMHEIAHALVGPGKGHGPEWKAMARALGATPRSAQKDAVSVPKRYEATHHCGRVFKRDRMPSTARYCGVCLRASSRDWEVSRLTWVDTRTDTVVGVVALTSTRAAAYRIGY